MPDRPLEKKVAVVTGASRGIGRAVASKLAGLGASVVVVARTVVPRDDLPGTIGQVVSDIEAAGGSAVAFAADLTDPADVERLASETLQAFGHVDILVNNAAAIDDLPLPFWETSIETWRDAFQLNVHTPWMLTKAFAAGMRERGSGLIVNVSSRVARPLNGELLPVPPAIGGLNAFYPATKAALNQLTSYIGNELRAVGITMVSIDPGFTATESAIHTTYSWYGKEVAETLLPDAQPVEVTAAAIGFIATSADPSDWAAKVLVARQLVDEHRLLDTEMGRGTAVAFTP